MREEARARDHLALVRRGGSRSEESSAPTDEELLRAVEHGEGRSADDLYDRLYPLVDRTIVRIMGRRESDHEDLIQATFEQIVLTMAKGRCARVRNLNAWASTISSRIAFNALRSLMRERRVLDRSREVDDAIPIGSRNSDVEREVGVHQQLERARFHLSEMTEARATTLFLHDGLGYDLAEISALTQVSVAAAQSRLVRGRRQLRRRLEADDRAREESP